jgi:hypothetical protein
MNDKQLANDEKVIFELLHALVRRCRILNDQASAKEMSKCATIIAALRRGPETYKAVKGGGRLTYDKATRTIRDSDGVVRLELSEGDADMFCECPPSSEMVMMPMPDAVVAVGAQSVQLSYFSGNRNEVIALLKRSAAEASKKVK